MTYNRLLSVETSRKQKTDMPDQSTASQLSSHYDRLRSSCGSLALSDFTLLKVTGADALDWLQGQASNDLRIVRSGGSISFCFCDPTGRLIAPVDAWGLGDHILLSVPNSALERVLARFEELVILEDVKVQSLASDLALFTIQGPHLPAGSMIPWPTLSNDRSGLGGIDVLLPKDDLAAAIELERLAPPVSKEALTIVHMEYGMPDFTLDADAKTLPPELGPRFEAKHISYTKGCYTGQEVLMRIHSRGHTNRTWRVLMCSEPVEVGSRVAHPSREDAGIVSSAVISPHMGVLAGAMMRNEIASPGESVWVMLGSKKVPATVASL